MRAEDRVRILHMVEAGEAASKVTQETREAQPQISWRAIVSMRNRLIHAYFEIDMDLVWVAATQEIPLLASQLRPILTPPTQS